MVDDRFIEYFKRWKSKGYSEDQIRDSLIKQGYSAKLIEDAVIASRISSAVVSSRGVSTSINASTSFPNTYRKTLTVATVLLTVLIVIVLAYFIVHKDVNILGSDNESITVFDNSTWIDNADSNDKSVVPINNNSISTNMSNTANNISSNTSISWSSSGGGGSSGGGSGGGSSGSSEDDSDPTPTCSDGSMNGDETGIDCGGSCIACISCNDSIQNGNETDIDCGGNLCEVCPTCSDGSMNGDETGIDCGGSCTACDMLSCSDTCSSLQYQCGVSTICGDSVDCGDCKVRGYDVGLECISNSCVQIVRGNTYYVATNGSNSNPGTISQPFATLQYAIYIAEPGDVVYIRGGTYYPTAVITWHPSDSVGFDGTPDAPISYLNYPGETPIFDFINKPQPITNYSSGFDLLGVDYIHLRGLTIRNVLQLRDFVECLGLYAGDCTNIIFENIVIHNVDGNAFRFFGSWRYPASGHPTDSWYNSSLEGYIFPDHANYPGDNSYFINCDAYNNWDWRPRVVGAILGGAADGYKTVNEPGSTIVFDSCRAWNNSDDGFDPGTTHFILINNSWSFQNGALNGDGTGFKTGGVYNSTPLLRMVTNTIAANNTAAGYFLLEYYDYTRTNARFYNNFAYGGSTGFFPSLNDAFPNPVAIWRNNLAYGNVPFSNAYMLYTASHNTWNYVPGFPGYEQAFSLTDDDFVNLDVSQLRGPRKSDGSLPDITFGHLKNTSVLIDAGTDVGISYAGLAPDIGAFEYNLTIPQKCYGPKIRPCALDSAVGQQSRNCVSGNWSNWGVCTFVSCDTGYVLSGNVCIIGPGWSRELLLNGGFEQSLFGWTTYDNNWVVGAYESYGDTSHPSQGGHYCAYHNLSSTISNYVYQDVNLTLYAEYIDSDLLTVNVSGWGISTATQYPYTKARIQFMFLNLTKEVIFTPIDTGYVLNNTWWKANLSNYPVPTNTRYIRVWGNTYQTLGGDVAGDLDSFSVKVNVLE